MPGRTRMRYSGGGGGNGILTNLIQGIGSKVEIIDTPEGPVFKPKSGFMNFLSGGIGRRFADELNAQQALENYNRSADTQARMGILEQQGSIRQRLDQDQFDMNMLELRKKADYDMELAKEKARIELENGLTTQAQKTMDDAYLKQEQYKIDMDIMNKTKDREAQINAQKHTQQLAEQNNLGDVNLLGKYGLRNTQQNASEFDELTREPALRGALATFMAIPQLKQSEVNTSRYLAPGAMGLYDTSTGEMAVEPRSDGNALLMNALGNNAAVTGSRVRKQMPEGTMKLGSKFLVPKDKTVPAPQQLTPGVQQVPQTIQPSYTIDSSKPTSMLNGTISAPLLQNNPTLDDLAKQNPDLAAELLRRIRANTPYNYR